MLLSRLFLFCIVSCTIVSCSTVNRFHQRRYRPGFYTEGRQETAAVPKPVSHSGNERIPVKTPRPALLSATQTSKSLQPGKPALPVIKTDQHQTGHDKDKTGKLRNDKRRKEAAQKTTAQKKDTAAPADPGTAGKGFGGSLLFVVLVGLIAGGIYLLVQGLLLAGIALLVLAVLIVVLVILAINAASDAKARMGQTCREPIHGMAQPCKRF